MRKIRMRNFLLQLCYLRLQLFIAMTQTFLRKLILKNCATCVLRTSIPKLSDIRRLF